MQTNIWVRIELRSMFSIYFILQSLYSGRASDPDNTATAFKRTRKTQFTIFLTQKPRTLNSLPMPCPYITQYIIKNNNSENPYTKPNITSFGLIITCQRANPRLAYIASANYQHTKYTDSRILYKHHRNDRKERDLICMYFVLC